MPPRWKVFMKEALSDSGLSVSTKQETVTPFMTTSIFGQDAINLVAAASCEPADSPSELWLGSSVGSSFPAGERS